jgi:hypothetical protein
MPVVLEWNGEEIPKVLQSLPRGRYVLQPVDGMRALTPEEEVGLEQAARDLDAGEVLTPEEVRAQLEGILRR